jgi:hypothetical protein
MFTAENWRNFPRLRLVLPIRPMTSFFTNFYFFGTPNIALLLGGSIGSRFLLFEFFCPAGDLSILGFLNGLFVITLLSSRWIVRNWSRVLLRISSKSGHMPRSRGCFLDNGNKGIALRWDCTVWQKVPIWLDCSGGKVPVGLFGH